MRSYRQLESSMNSANSRTKPRNMRTRGNAHSSASSNALAALDKPATNVSVFATTGSKGTWQGGLPGKRHLLDKLAVCAFASRPSPSVILSSSAVERSAVNRLVVGSNPTSGAICKRFVK